MLKILYVMGEGSQHNNIELRWSLRSLEKFCDTPVEPVVVGSVPDWFAGDALEVEDRFAHKEQNIFNAICEAVESGLVDDEEFQISADDHFWLRPVDLARMPIFFREPIIPEWNGKGNNHAKALCGTRDMLLGAGYPAMNTAVHCNQWVRSEDVRRAREFARYFATSFTDAYGVVSWALFPNMAIGGGRQPRHPIVYKRDVKLRDTDMVNATVEIGDSPIASVNDRAFECQELVDRFMNLYPVKSKWEK